MTDYTDNLSNIVAMLYDNDLCEVSDDIEKLDEFIRANQTKINETTINLTFGQIETIFVERLGKENVDAKLFWDIASNM